MVAADSDYLDYVLDCMAAARLGPVQQERLFSGRGLRIDGELFAVILRGTLYFVVDDQTRPRFIAAGMGPFTYARKDVQREILRWYELPEDVLIDADELREWAHDAIAAVRRTAKPVKKAKTPKAVKPKTRAKTAAPKKTSPKKTAAKKPATAKKPARRKAKPKARAK